MKDRLERALSWQGGIGRGTYVIWALLLCAIKYNFDRFLIWRWTGERWSLLDYTKAGEYFWPRIPSFEDPAHAAAMLGIAAPFMAAGVLLTVKRLRSAGLSLWVVLLFFVPVAKFFLFALLALAPAATEREKQLAPGDDPKRWLGRFIPRGAFASALAGVLVTAAMCALAVWFGTSLLPQYGWSLFLGVPFAVGFLATLIFGYHAKRSFAACMGVCCLATFAGAAALLLVAIEGMICIVMASPLAVPMTMVGGAVAHRIQASDWWQGKPSRVLCVATVLPLLMALEYWQPAPLPLLRVKTAIVVDAPPEAVWQNVVSFAELPPPREALFKLGIAYPIRARIDGKGVGAIRHCEFSTGPFVEPIEVWDEPNLLRFSVTSNPAPMQEWTPYSDLHPAHLDGFLESRAGQFRLERRADGSTLLEGTTWYHHHMWPAWYWQRWSDYIIHTIHLRVLRHVKQLTESKQAFAGD